MGPDRSEGPNAGDRSLPRAAGARVLIPGWPQYVWRQSGRGAILFGSYASAVGVGMFAWGTWASPALLLIAFGTHVASAADVVRQRAFPGFGRWVPVVSATTGLALVYAPLVGSCCMLAWPGENAHRAGEGYLVNCWAYRQGFPAVGDLIWYEGPASGPGRVGRVLAVAGQEFEWRDHAASGQVAASPSTPPPRTVPHVILRVPQGHLLVMPLETDLDLEFPARPAETILVETRQARGRVWARHAPLWDRQLLHRLAPP